METLKATSKCGCEAGYFLCTEAENLWRKVNDTYHKAQQTKTLQDWNAYDTARLDYGRHMLPCTVIDIEKQS